MALILIAGYVCNMDDSDKIAAAVVKALEDSRHISREEHRHHHNYLASKIARDEKWTEVLDQVKIHLMKVGSLAIITVLFVALYQYVKINLHN